MKAHDVFYFIKLKTVMSPCKEIWLSWILNSVPWILHSGFFVSGTWIPHSNYKWDPEYLTFIPDSKRKISQIPDSLTWGDSDPKINTFSVKLKPVNWASNYCRLSVHVVLVTALKGAYITIHWINKSGRGLQLPDHGICHVGMPRLLKCFAPESPLA